VQRFLEGLVGGGRYLYMRSCITVGYLNLYYNYFSLAYTYIYISIYSVVCGSIQSRVGPYMYAMCMCMRGVVWICPPRASWAPYNLAIRKIDTCGD